MGTIIHTAIVVTGSSWPGGFLELHERTVEIFKDTYVHVTEPTRPGVNGVVSFLIAPDGSKLGWPERGAADQARAAFWVLLSQHSALSTHAVQVDYGEMCGGLRVDESAVISKERRA